MADQDDDSKSRKRAFTEGEGEGTNADGENLDTTMITTAESDSVDDKEDSGKGETNQESQFTSEEAKAADDKEARDVDRYPHGTVGRFGQVVLDIMGLSVGSKETALAFIEYVQTKIPYASEKKLDQEFLSIYKASFGGDVQIDTATLDELINFVNDDALEILRMLPPDQALPVAKGYAKARARLESAEELNRGKMSLLKILQAWVENLRDVESTLNECADFSQAETVGGTGGPSTHAKIAERYGVDLKNDNAAGGHKKASALLHKAEEKEWTFRRPSENDNKESYDKLKIVARNWISVISGARYNLNQGEKGKEAIAKTCGRLRDPNDKTTDLFFPGTKSGEVDCVHPVFVELLRSIADCWTKEKCVAFSPAKTKIRSSRIVTAFGQRKKRVADVCMDKPGQFLFLVFDHIMKLFIELKPLFRSNQDLKSLFEEAFEQVVAHLSKYIHHCFNFYQTGVSAKATGVSATLAYVSVHELELKMGGKASGDPVLADLSLHKGRKYPLMTIECFNKWTGLDDTQRKTKKGKGDGKRASLLGLRSELYGEMNKGVNEDGIPLGIVLLWDIMAKRRSDLFGPDYAAMFPTTSCGRLLGTGSFSVIFQGGKDVVMKVPALATKTHVVHEAEILEFLDRARDEVDELALVVLKKREELEFQLGGLQKRILCLRLSPLGTPILQFADGLKDERLPVLAGLADQLDDALKYIHQKGVVHLDVAPKNIVVSVTQDSPRAFLVDFGCSTKMDESVVGFVGTPKFAAGITFAQYPGKEWKPSAWQDYVGLGLSFSVLVNGGVGDWDMMSLLRSKTTNAEIQEAVISRQQMSLDPINKEVVEIAFRDKCSKWIQGDVIRSGRALACLESPPIHDF